MFDTLGGFQYTYSGLLSISRLECDARACISHKTTVIYVAAAEKTKTIIFGCTNKSELIKYGAVKQELLPY